MTGTDEADWPVEHQSHPPGALVYEQTVFYMQIPDETGRWEEWDARRTDRDELTRVQADRARRFPQEKRRVLRRVIQLWVDEVEGDGEGETGRDELLARNEEITARLIREEVAAATTKER